MTFRLKELRIFRNALRNAGYVGVSAVLSMLIGAPAVSAPGDALATPSTRAELPIEVETETSPAGSLKNIPLWKEVAELLEEPNNYVCPDDDPATPFTDENVRCISGTDRRESFGAAPLDPLVIVNPCHNVLTGQNLRFRPDEEIDWNQPGPLFDPSEVVDVVDLFEMPDGSFIQTNIPAEQRTIIGYLVINEDDELVVANPGPNVGDPGVSNPMIPPDGTVIAEPACIDGVMMAEDEDTGIFGPVE